MTEFKSPYNFVPLSTFVHFPHWDDQVSHDIPFQDGFSGSFDLKIEAKSPIFTRCDRKYPGDGENEYRFLSHDGTPKTAFIKGSTLRGMLREVVAVASFSKFSKVDERRFGIRDISHGRTPYAIEMRGAKSGWLYIDRTQAEPRYYIRACREARVHREALREFHQRKTGRSWNFKLKKLADRNDTWKAPRDVRANISSGKNGRMIANIAEEGQESGRLVFFGFIKHNDKPELEKKHGYFFYAKEEKERKVSEEVWQKFVWAHSSSQQRPGLGLDGQEPTEALAYWLERLKEDPTQPVPVFYLEDTQGNISDFGLAKMFRIASDFSVYEAVRNVSKAHFDTRRLDLAELIFGTVGAKEGAQTGAPESLRGRVSITHADVVPGTVRALSSVDALLSSPRASFNPAYLRADRHGGVRYWDRGLAKRGKKREDAAVSGWKRYPARPGVNPKPPRNENNRKLETRFWPLDEGVQFKARVYFHNLRPVELGALLWSLRFGEHVDEAVHQLGMAKSLGYGQVSLSAEKIELLPNDPRVDKHPSSEELITEFECYMSALRADSEWLTSEQLVHLIAMATPRFGDMKELVYPELSEFKRIKNKGRALGAPDGVAKTREKLGQADGRLQECALECRDELSRLRDAREARSAERARREAELIEERKAQRLVAKHSQETARRAALSPVERALEDIAPLSEEQALSLVRERFYQPDDYSVEDEEAHEALRQALYQTYYEFWSKSRPRTEAHHGADRLKNFAKSLREPELADELAADGGEERSPWADLPAQKAAILEGAGEDKGLLKNLWNDPNEDMEAWDLPSLEQYQRQATASVHPRAKKRSKSDKKWLKQIERLIKKTRDDK